MIDTKLIHLNFANCKKNGESFGLVSNKLKPKKYLFFVPKRHTVTTVFRKKNHCQVKQTDSFQPKLANTQLFEQYK